MKNFAAAKGFSVPGHHEADPGSWLQASGMEPPEEFPSHAISSEDRMTVLAEPLWDWAYLTVPQHELWTDIWEEWPNNMEAN